MKKLLRKQICWTTISIALVILVIVFVKSIVHHAFVWIDFYYSKFIVPLFFLFALYVMVRGAFRIANICRLKENDAEDFANDMTKKQKAILNILFWVQMITIGMVVCFSIAGISRASVLGKDTKFLQAYEQSETAVTVRTPWSSAYCSDITLYENTEDGQNRIYVSIEGAKGNCAGISSWWYARHDWGFPAEKRTEANGYQEIQRENVTGDCLVTSKTIKIRLVGTEGYVYLSATSDGNIDLTRTEIQQRLIQFGLNELDG